MNCSPNPHMHVSAHPSEPAQGSPFQVPARECCPMPSLKIPARRRPGLFHAVWIVACGLLAAGSRADAYSNPIAISTDDKLIFAVDSADSRVVIIRPDTLEVLANVPVGGRPASLAVTPDKRWVYVAKPAQNTVSVIRIDVGAWAGFQAAVDPGVGVNGELTTGASPCAVACSPDGRRVFVANGQQDTITVIDAERRTILGNVDLRNSIANDPDRRRHFQPGALAVSADSTRLYVTRFLSFTRPGGRQGDDLGKEGLVAVLDIKTTSTSIADYKVARVIRLASRSTGFAVPGVTNAAQAETFAFPNQLNSIVIRGDHAYLPNIAASPSGPLRFNLDTHAFVNVIGGVNSTSPVDLGAINLHLGARDPEPGRSKLFFANPWSIAFTTPTGEGSGYVVSAASDLLVKIRVGADGRPDFTVDGNTTRYIDLNDPSQPATAGRNAGKNPQGIVITSDGTRAYVVNQISRNVSVVDLTTDAVIKSIPLGPLPAPGSLEERIAVGAEVFFSSRGHFDPVNGATVSLRERLSSEGWQACSSCHPHGLTDGVVWQFAAGPRKSVQMNGTFNPRHPDRQRVLNYSAIFDEVEDFEINIRNVSGPGNLPNTNPPQLDPDHGILIGDDGNPNNPPSVLNSLARANADRPQLTVTLPGSSVAIPAQTALREWFRHAIRTPNAPLPGFGGAGASASQIAEGRQLFQQVGCVTCHGGSQWTIAVKDFISPPSPADIFTERTPAPLSGNPVGTQYLNRFLRDAASFNLGVPGGGNEFGGNIGAVEQAAPTVVNGAIAPGPDALGKDYNGDGAGAGYNVPSLLGILAMPPYNHNGAAESVAEILEDPRHWQHGNGDVSLLGDPARRAALAAFIESIDASTPFFNIAGEPLVVDAPAVTGAGFNATWVGGAGPFSLEKKQEIDEAHFAHVAATAGRAIQDVASGPTAWYRIVDLGHAPTLWLNLALHGSAVRPNGVDTSGVGFGYLRVKGNTLSFTVAFENLSSPVTGAFLRGPASSANPGGILIDLTPFKNAGATTSGTFIGATPITPDQKAAILGNTTYVDLTTTLNPNGEIRGQGINAAMTASLTGTAERPVPVRTPARGFGLFTLVGRDLSFQVHYSGLSGPATAAHIHGPAPDSAAAGVLIDLRPHAVGSPGVAGAYVGTVTLDAAQLAAIGDGLAYVNIHSSAKPGGEIRGQISPVNASVPLSAALTGASEKPNPVDGPATGFASVQLTGRRLEFRIVYRGLSGPATAAHIHGPAPASGAAGVLLDLAPFHHGPFGPSGEISGAIDLGEDWVRNVLNGDTYVNVHTARNPGGEIRGQIAPVLLDTVLRGASVRPTPVTSDALGSARLALLGSTLSLQVDYLGLGGPANAATLNGPADPAQVAPGLINLQPFALGGLGRSGFILGTTPVSPSHSEAIVDGLAYLNLGTTANPGGEIRGQIRAVVDPGTRPVDPGAVVDAYTAALNDGDVERALSFVADDAVYDRPAPLGILNGKAAIRGFVQDLVSRNARIQLLGLRVVEGESVRWHSRVTLRSAANPSEAQILLNDSSSIVRNGLIILHTARPAP